MLAIESPYPQFFDLDGRPLDAGYIYIGQQNQNPETAPMTVFWDADMTIPAAQPLRTLNGMIVRNGTQAFVYAPSDHSMVAQNKRRVPIFYAPTSKQFSISGRIDALQSDLHNNTDETKGSALIGFIQKGLGAIGRWVLDKLREQLSVTDFGAKGDGSTDDTDALEKALAVAAGRTLFFPAGDYIVSRTLLVKSGTTLYATPGSVVLSRGPGLGLGSPILTNESTAGDPLTYGDLNIHLFGLIFDGGNLAGCTNSLVALIRTRFAHIEHCEFRNHSYIGVSVSRSRDLTCSWSKFHHLGNPVVTPEGGPAFWCAKLGEDSFDISVEYCWFYDNEWSAAYFSPNGGSFSNNWCRRNRESTVFINRDGFKLRLDNLDIDTATRKYISASGIEAGGSNLIITKPRIRNCGNHGIALTDTNGVIIDAPEIENNGQEPGYFSNNAGIGIAGLDPTHLLANIQILGGTARDTQSVKTQQYGVIVANGGGNAAVDLSIDGLNCRGVAVKALQYDAASWGPGCYHENVTDADGSAPKRFKLVRFQIAAVTGAQAVTGVGFRPRAIEVVATLASTTQSYQSIGAYDGSSIFANLTYADGSVRGGAVNNTSIVRLESPAGSIVTDSVLASLDVDGFTLNNSVVTGRPWCFAKCWP